MKRARLSISEPISEPEVEGVLPFPDAVTRRVMHPWPRSQVPEIDGSQGAFLGVVVGLSVLIVICCGAVFYLLRHHEPTEQDRAARRAARYERSATRRGQALAFAMGSSAAGSAEDGGDGSALGSLSDKVKRAWQTSTGGWSGRKGRGQFGRGGRGWMRASSNDEWAPHSDHEDEDDRRENEGRNAAGSRQNGSRMKPLPLPTLDSREPLRPHDSAPVFSSPGSEEGTGEGGRSDSAVRIIESPSSDTASGFVPVVRHAYGTAFMDSPFQSKTTTTSMSMSHVGLPRPRSPLSPSSPGGSSPRGSGGSVDDESHEVYGVFRGEDRRHHSTMSNGSVWTQAGSKFIEDI